ncbi:dTDP-4-amino-4,6-dideoxygalactose transaminase [Winogradskyella epiphytica]|uniref:dTDP-4-amino-4,6-dideoxygalactose transaminase n=1 Tax=Winogradskyella epiphytica TaxID=262005 RepID=A0A2V4WTY7_9FLAO|nr:DegT/DnrJ/EryC1/StrS family aminotransferase [Winogradskyella epiphytica]PYE80122.1 dTDP-4-amino-4,6-dideoxygalactose transaminase [Winogradskyella epiphytica]GGW71569.1 aminotransferase [Winogradskyella epiphytica]
MIKFLDIHKINHRFREEFQVAFSKSLDNSHFILGANVSKFEKEFSYYCGTKHCIGTANGLDALTLILKGYIQLGKLKKGDQVIVPANTFIATILSILHADLEPVLVEPHPDTYTISSDSDKSIYANAKALIMVHLYGQLADVESLQQLAKDYKLLLIEDAAQAHGASSSFGMAGNLGHAAAFSFYPSKNLGALGDGGAVTTNDSELDRNIRLLRNYGSEVKYTNEIIGVNSRLDDMQAAFLSIKLKRLDEDNERRRNIAKLYLNEIRNSKIKLPFYDGSKNHVFYAFVVEVDNREKFTNFLNENQIEWLIHYPIPPHRQEALKTFAHLQLPITEKIHNRIISLPMSPLLKDEEVQTLIRVLNAY